MKSLYYVLGKEDMQVTCLIEPVEGVNTFYRITCDTINLGFIFKTITPGGLVVWQCSDIVLEPVIDKIGSFIMLSEAEELNT